jgi:hypothetical protein
VIDAEFDSKSWFDPRNCDREGLKPLVVRTDLPDQIKPMVKKKKTDTINIKDLTHNPYILKLKLVRKRCNNLNSVSKAESQQYRNIYR